LLQLVTGTGAGKLISGNCEGADVGEQCEKDGAKHLVHDFLFESYLD
jgi:hypothetical protein